MKVIHRTGDELIVSMTADEYEQAAGGRLAEYEAGVQRIAREVNSLLAVKADEQPAKAKRAYKKREAKAAKVKPAKIKADKPAKSKKPIPPPSTSSKPTVIDKAIEIMGRMERPCLLEDVAQALVASGYKFRSSTPVKALGVAFSSSERIVRVGRSEGNKGLYDIKGLTSVPVNKPALDKGARLEMIKAMHNKQLSEEQTNTQKETEDEESAAN